MSSQNYIKYQVSFSDCLNREKNDNLKTGPEQPPKNTKNNIFLVSIYNLFSLSYFYISVIIRKVKIVIAIIDSTN